MTKTEAEQHLTGWYGFNERVYIYREFGASLGFFVVFIQKNVDEYETTKESELQLGKMKQDEMVKHLTSGRLIFHEEKTGWVDYKSYLKTKSCECGAWATRNPSTHAIWCPKYSKG